MLGQGETASIEAVRVEISRRLEIGRRMPRNSRRTRGGGARCGVWGRGRERNTAWIGVSQAEAATDGGCATRAWRQRSSNPPFQIPHPAPPRLAMTQQGRVCRTARLALVVCRSRQLPQHQARLLLEVSRVPAYHLSTLRSKVLAPSTVRLVLAGTHTRALVCLV